MKYASCLLGMALYGVKELWRNALVLAATESVVLSAEMAGSTDGALPPAAGEQPLPLNDAVIFDALGQQVLDWNIDECWKRPPIANGKKVTKSNKLEGK